MRKVIATRWGAGLGAVCAEGGFVSPVRGMEFASLRGFTDDCAWRLRAWHSDRPWGVNKEGAIWLEGRCFRMERLP
jgi:hypothetical protein